MSTSDKTPGVPTSGGSGTPTSATSKPSTQKTRTVKLLQCKFCTAMIPNNKSAAIDHFKKCRKKTPAVPSRPSLLPPPTVEQSFVKCTFCDKMINANRTISAAHRKSCLFKAQAKLRDLEKKYLSPSQPVNGTAPPPQTSKQPTKRPLPAKPNRTFALSKLHERLIKVCWVDGKVPLYRYRDVVPQPLPFNAYRCPVCRERFGSASLAEYHVIQHTTTNSGAAHNAAKLLPLSCNATLKWKSETVSMSSLCARRFRSMIDLKHHRLSHTARFKLVKRKATKRWKKGVGRSRFKLRWMMPVRMTMGVRASKNVLVCPDCPRKFGKCSSYKKHLQLKSALKFNWTDSLKNTRLAKLISTYSKGFRCSMPECLKQFPSNLHLRTHTRKGHPHDDSDKQDLQDNLLDPDPGPTPGQTQMAIVTAHVGKGKWRSGELVECHTCLEAGSQPGPPGRHLYSNQALRDHYGMYHIEAKCRDCPQVFMGSLAVKKHWLSVHLFNQPPPMNEQQQMFNQGRGKTSVYTCCYPGCLRKFAFLKALDEHYKTHTRPQNNTANQGPPLIVKNGWVEPTRIEPMTGQQQLLNQGSVERSSFTCCYPGCERKFTFLKALDTHYKTHPQNNTKNEEPPLIVKNEWVEPTGIEDSQEIPGWSVLPLLWDALEDGAEHNGLATRLMHDGSLDPLESV